MGEGAPWAIDHVTASQYQLTRLGGETADITLDFGDHPPGFLRNTGPWPRLSTGGSVTFICMVAHQVPTPMVTVTSGSDGERRTWTTELPPKRR